MGEIEDLSFKIADKLEFLLGRECDAYQLELMSRLEGALEKGGISIGMANMTPREYCRQLFWFHYGYLRPLLQKWVAMEINLEQETAEQVVEQLMALLPSTGHGE